MQSYLSIIYFFIILAVNASCQNSSTNNVSGQNQHDENVGMSNLSQTDPFIGIFKGNIDNNPIIIQLSKFSADEYNFYFNGQGPDKIQKTGNRIMMQGVGIDFSLEPIASGLLLRGNGKEVILQRDEPMPDSNAYQENQIEDDPFSGSYDMLSNGQNLGKVSLTKTGAANYLFTSAQGDDIAQRNGDQLSGTSSGTPFTIKRNGPNLILNLQGYDFLLTNRQTQSNNQANPGNGQIDQRLVGTWSVSTARSGSSSQQTYRFNSDGTMQYQYSYSAGGNGWSAGKTSDPVENSTYSVSNLNANGGILIISGQQSAYEFSNFGGEEKLIIGNKIFKRVY
ncbi:MAG: hypothetical protein IPG95_05715 [Saprospiraceae bacterium]|nr:hypothetical protein [Saprospiraceae bacterium]